MKTKKLTPRNSAPVQRENAATVSRDGNAIAPLIILWADGTRSAKSPFAGDDAE
ncbi:MAG: anacyclamide/piricyclamide family prenylated cyclic peptide [Microcystis sp. M113S1]|uniref:anacyclamide/piricyclamide family prenylated cyclic peptide n=1 Tax=Microcystis sp. M113S1 TaxID=2771104 RepID=UPI002586F590|nr:anacyclamide/piricyclamide family prenylated cyclic peptide [Microcystis sp. M113S1]MCA2940412.1 anacyclamide/piricyclamide family prenylated cyclic peptide [Microcystis sp. M113S1]